MIDAVRICQHVVCATDLVHGEPVFFGRDGVRSRTLGSSARAVDPARVVAFSAAFPGLLQPFVVKAADLFPVPGNSPEGNLVLVDGGVINNLGTQWWEPASGGTTGTLSRPIITIVVDASVALPRWSPAKYLPSKTLASASRVFSLIYSNSVRPRFEHLRREGSSFGTNAIGVSLAQDPIRALDANMGLDLGGRSSELRQRLSGRLQELRDLAVRAQDVPTGLSSLGFDAVRDLVTHGYYSAMIELAGAALVEHKGDGSPLECWFQPCPTKVE